MLPNWESGCQNQPSAKVAVSTATGAARSIGGTGIRATGARSQPASQADAPASNPQGQRFIMVLSGMQTVAKLHRAPIVLSLYRRANPQRRGHSLDVARSQRFQRYVRGEGWRTDPRTRATRLSANAVRLRTVSRAVPALAWQPGCRRPGAALSGRGECRSEEHTSEL